MTHSLFVPAICLAALAGVGHARAASLDQVAQDADVDIQGAWQAERYLLEDGTEHPVAGLIFFTGNDWTVLFFVLDESGTARRGSGEGGSFTLSGDRLVLTHRYHLSAGEAMPGLAASELRMVARGPDDDAPEEPCQVVRDGDRLRLSFPSGNMMTFSRSGGHPLTARGESPAWHREHRGARRAKREEGTHRE